MFHVELMSKSKKNKIMKAIDHLVSESSFDIYWDNTTQCAWTDVEHIDSLDFYYESQDYISHHSSIQSLTQRLYFWARALMISYKYAILKKLIPPKSALLDMGCGTGSFLSFMKKKGYQVFGVEKNTNARRVCDENDIKVYPNEAELSTNRFDIITLWHVLEHLAAPEQRIAAYHNLLKSQGILVIAAPNFDSHDRMHYHKDWAALDVPRHLWHFTPKGMISMVEEIGFKLIKKSPLWLDVFYICYLSEKHRKKIFPLLRGLIKGCFFSFRSLFSAKHSSLVFVFRKQAPLR